jgi:hypothetical protein
MPKKQENKNQSCGKPVGRPENLLPFSTGYDPRRNVTGENRKLPIYNEIMAKVLGEQGQDGITEAEKVVRRTLISAKAGNTRAAELIIEWAYGKITQRVELSGDITLNKVEFTRSADKDK